MARRKVQQQAAGGAADGAAELAAAASEAQRATAELGRQLALVGIGAPSRRGRGRPPGALNRSTLDLLRYLEEGCGHEPAAVQLADLAAGEEAMLQRVARLARVLDCSRIAAAELVRQCLVQLLPYWHKRQPLALDVAHRQPVPLAFGFDLGSGEASGPVLEAAATVLDLLPGPAGESEQDQGLSDDGGERV